MVRVILWYWLLLCTVLLGVRPLLCKLRLRLLNLFRKLLLLISKHDPVETTATGLCGPLVMVIVSCQAHLLARDIFIWFIHYCLASYSTDIIDALMIARMS